MIFLILIINTTIIILTINTIIVIIAIIPIVTLINYRIIRQSVCSSVMRPPGLHLCFCSTASFILSEWGKHLCLIFSVRPVQIFSVLGEGGGLCSV